MEKIVFKPIGGSPVVLQRKIPPSLQPLLIPGSFAISGEEKFATVLYQLIKFPGCDFGYWTMDCKKDVSLSVQRERPFTMLLISLQQQANCFLYGLGNLSLPTNSSYLLHLPVLDATLHFEKGKQYSFLGLEFAPEVYANYAPEFPLLDMFLRDSLLQPAESSNYLDTPLALPDSVIKLITDLLAADYTHRANVQYGNTLLKAILQLLLSESNAVLSTGTAPVTLLHQLRKDIQADILHAPDFNHAALKHNISQAKLVKDFKALYSLPPQQYWQYYRMSYYASRQIIETRKKIKTIVAGMGFGKETGNFVRKFKSFCGVAPLKYKKIHSAIGFFTFFDCLITAF